jgi:hypothetical protein
MKKFFMGIWKFITRTLWICFFIVCIVFGFWLREVSNNAGKPESERKTHMSSFMKKFVGSDTVYVRDTVCVEKIPFVYPNQSEEAYGEFK